MNRQNSKPLQSSHRTIPQHVKNLTKKFPTQPCLRCGFTMGAIAGTKAAICRNCGYKDPCCE